MRLPAAIQAIRMGSGSTGWSQQVKSPTNDGDLQNGFGSGVFRVEPRGDAGVTEMLQCPHRRRRGAPRALLTIPPHTQREARARKLASCAGATGHEMPSRLAGSRVACIPRRDETDTSQLSVPPVRLSRRLAALTPPVARPIRAPASCGRSAAARALCAPRPQPYHPRGLHGPLRED